MMIDRRTFLGGVLGLALGPTAADGRQGPASRQYRADLAGCDLRVLGLPRRRSLIAEGLHPVTPERVVVVDDGDRWRFANRHRGLERRLRREEDRWRKRWPNDPPLPQEKLDLCVGLMDRLTAHYHRADLFPGWAKTLWLREGLGSTGIGFGLGLLHDFQPCDTRLGTANGIVDWWLVLLPGGVDWQALDDRPVHYMIGPVMEQRKPGDYLRVMEAISRSLRHVVSGDGFDPAAWAARLAALPREEAAREFNRAVVRGLAGSR